MAELKPCPFCGGSAYPAHETDADGMRWHFIRCVRCGVRTRGKWHSPGNDCPQLRAEVRDEWNQRAADGVPNRCTCRDGKGRAECPLHDVFTQSELVDAITSENCHGEAWPDGMPGTEGQKA